MTQKYGKAGHSVRKMASKRRIIYLGVVAFMFLIIWLWANNIGTLIKLGLPATIILVIGLWVAFNDLEKTGIHIKKRIKDAERGARAEERVEEKLSSLEGYISFHNLVFEGFNIDHLIIGPAGVFVIETKSHKGKITSEGDSLFLNGKPPVKNFTNQVWSQTFHVKNLLKQRTGNDWLVKPILCFSNAFVEVRETVKGVTVINIGYVNTFISRQKAILSMDEISKLRKIFISDRKKESEW